MEDHVRRYSLVLREVGAELAERFPELEVLGRDIAERPGDDRLLRPGLLRHPRILTEDHRALTLQDGIRVRLQAQAAEARVVRAQEAGSDQLTEHRPPLLLGELEADPERADRRVAVLEHLLGRTSEQDVDQMAHAEAFARPVHAGQRLLCGDRSVPARRRAQAVVAVAAVAGVRFAEVREQALAPALDRLAVAEQLRQLLPLDAFALLVRVRPGRSGSASSRRRTCRRSAARRTATRRVRRGRSPGSSPRRCAADRDGRRSGRPACRSPCRTRSSRRRSRLPPSGSGPGAGGACRASRPAW